MQAEIICGSKKCPSAVPDFNFWHRQLVPAQEDRANLSRELAYMPCPLCGELAQITRYVPDEHKFAMGEIVMTNTVAALELSQVLLKSMLDRHVRGDWGDLDAEDVRENEASIEYDPAPDAEHVQMRRRVLSSYGPIGDQDKLWIITEAGRQATTFLLPEDY